MFHCFLDFFGAFKSSQDPSEVLVALTLNNKDLRQYFLLL